MIATFPISNIATPGPQGSVACILFYNESNCTKPRRLDVCRDVVRDGSVLAAVNRENAERYLRCAMPLPPAPGTPSILVGRDRELGVLHERLAATLAGRGGLVLIGGEAGIGKTALVEALCRDADAVGALVLTG